MARALLCLAAVVMVACQQTETVQAGRPLNPSGQPRNAAESGIAKGNAEAGQKANAMNAAAASAMQAAKERTGGK